MMLRSFLLASVLIHSNVAVHPSSENVVDEITQNLKEGKIICSIFKYGGFCFSILFLLKIQTPCLP